MCGATTTNTNELALTEKNSSSCACCATPIKDLATDAPASAAFTSEYLVTGMTCGHCVSSVTEELSALNGVGSVVVELDAGGTSRVTVGSAARLDLDIVRAAVDEAGYTLVTSAS